MTQSIALDIAVIPSATDLITVAPALASAACYVQNKGPDTVLVAFTSEGSAPAAGYFMLRAGEIFYGTAAHIYVKTLSGFGSLAVGTTG